MYSVVILSKDARNLVPCVDAIRCNEPALPKSRIIVVDDGARQDAPELGVNWVSGRKPFNYSLNANIGIEAADPDDVFLLNDDAQLLTPNGLTELSRVANEHPEYGIISAAVNCVGNVNQMYKGWDHIRDEPKILCFVAVYIRRKVLRAIGPLDERYNIDYGVQDGDYSYRVLLANYKLGVWDGCEFDHTKLKSSYRGDGPRSFAQNARLFEEKWGIKYC